MRNLNSTEIQAVNGGSALLFNTPIGAYMIGEAMLQQSYYDHWEACHRDPQS